MLLAGLLTATVGFAPLFDRAMQQALTGVTLERASVEQSGLRISSSAIDDVGFFSAIDPRSMTPEQVLALVPEELRRHYRTPTLGYSADAAQQGGIEMLGLLLWREGACEHVTLVRGRCPEAAGEIAVSVDDARVFDLHVGDPMPVAGAPERHGERVTAPTAELTVVAAYRQPATGDGDADDYWFGTRLTGVAGTVDPSPPSRVRHDTWLTVRDTFTSPALPALPNETGFAELPLDADRAGVDDVVRLAGELDRLETDVSQARADTVVELSTDLPSIADQIDQQRAQARVTVPLVMAQLALLALVVLWLVLLAVTDQRRPEVALARLRGHGRRGACRLLLGELLPVVLGGAVPGVVLAVIGCWWARAALLPGSAPFELGRPFLVAVALAVVVLAAATLLAVLRVAREPLQTLLRRVPPRRSGWAMGTADAVVVVACGSAFAALVSGGLQGQAGLTAPALLAVVVGLVLAHLTTPLARLLGQGMLRGGRLAGALGLLETARNPATRRVVAVVTIATALATFSADAVSVAARNRTYAAEQESGAARVAGIEGSDVLGVRSALRAVDPRGEHVTAVVTIAAPGEDASTTVAVAPAEFARIGYFPVGRPPARTWQDLVPRSAAPIRLTGRRLALTIAADTVRSTTTDGGRAPVSLVVDLFTADGASGHTTVPLPRGRRPSRLAVGVPCRSGCVMTGLGLLTAPASSMRGRLTLTDLEAVSERGRVRLPLGPAEHWIGIADPDVGSLTPISDRPEQITFAVRTDGSAEITMTHAWIPPRLPVLVTSPAADGTEPGDPAVVTGLDGVDRPALVTGAVPLVPGAPENAVVVDLDSATRGVRVSPNAVVEVWFDDDDPALLAEVEQALRPRGIVMAGGHTVAQVRAPYEQSMATWSLGLVAVVGLAGLLVALLVLLVTTATTWRVRARDLAALAMSGVPPRVVRGTALWAQVPAVLIAVVAGAAAGVVGAHLTLPVIPILARQPEVSTLDLGTAWSAVIGAGVAALLAVVVASVVLGAAVAARARLSRLKELV